MISESLLRGSSAFLFTDYFSVSIFIRRVQGSLLLLCWDILIFCFEFYSVDLISFHTLFSVLDIVLIGLLSILEIFSH